MQKPGKIVLILFLLVSWVLLSPVARAQSTGQSVFGSVKSAVVMPDKVQAGQKAVILVTFAVNDGYHINANKPGDEASIPTILSLSAAKIAGVVVGQPAYPEPKSISTSYASKPIKGYDSAVVIRVPITVKATAKPAVVKVTGALRAQGCNATTCYPPQSFPVTVSLTITGGKK